MAGSLETKGREYLTPPEAAAKLRRSPATLASWRTLNKGPVYSKFGGKVLYAVSDLEDFIRAHERQGTRDAG